MAGRLTKENTVSNVYYNLEEGFGSIQETYRKAKAKDPSIILDDVRNFMRKQPNKQIKGYRGSNSYTAPFARFEYQIDIMVMAPLSKDPEVTIKVSKSEPKYALVVIDIFSKYADMEENNSKTVLSALKQTFKKMGYPTSIYSENDGAFQSVVKEFFDAEGIEHNITQTHANVAERFIRTMKNIIHDRARFNQAR